jgi:hypothetical protein
MAQEELSREVLEGLAQAAGIDLESVSVETLMKGDLPVVWEGIRRLGHMKIQNELPAFASVLEEGSSDD